MSLPPRPPADGPSNPFPPPPDGVDPSRLPPPVYAGGPPPGSSPAYPPAYPPGYPAGPYGAPPPMPAWARPKPPRMPVEPAEYQQILRSPSFRWWKPILTLLLFGALSFVAIQLMSLVLLLVGAARGENPLDYLNDVLGSLTGTQGMGPIAFLFTNLTLIVLIPMAMVARRIVYGQPMKYLFSVSGWLRGRWLLRCLIIVFPIYGVYIGLSTFFQGQNDPLPPYWAGILVVALLTTPLQCAAEEVAFRGLIMQTIGSWFRNPLVGVIVAAPFAIGLFAAAHGSPDPWILAQLGIFALACVIVTWRTGGLEAAIVLHCGNNVILMFVNVIYGGWASSFIDSGTTGDPVSALIELGLQAILVSLILWQAKKAGIDRHYRPTRPVQTSDVYGTVLPSSVAVPTASQGRG